VSVNDTVELPVLKLQRPVKSMQMFRRWGLVSVQQVGSVLRPP
jgi:hypothetical protein